MPASVVAAGKVKEIKIAARINIVEWVGTAIFMVVVLCLSTVWIYLPLWGRIGNVLHGHAF